jgi:hypothetical protein
MVALGHKSFARPQPESHSESIYIPAFPFRFCYSYLKYLHITCVEGEFARLRILLPPAATALQSCMIALVHHHPIALQRLLSTLVKQRV